VSDKVCDTCHFPKPSLCFDHSESRHGSRVNTCQSCLRDVRWASRKRGSVRRAETRRDKPLNPLAPRRSKDVADALVNGWNHRWH